MEDGNGWEEARTTGETTAGEVLPSAWRFRTPPAPPNSPNRDDDMQDDIDMLIGVGSWFQAALYDGGGGVVGMMYADMVEDGDEEDGTDDEELEDDEQDDESDDEEGGSSSGYDDEFEEECSVGSSSSPDFLDFNGDPAPPRFASVDNTAGFMRILAAGAAVGEADQKDRGGVGGAGGGSEILVHYRYTYFWRASWLDRERGRDVSIRVGPKLHCARFLLASSMTDPESSLMLAGAALANIVYPGDQRRRDRDQLRALWSLLVAAAPMNIPPAVTRVEITVDVGSVLWCADESTPDQVARLLRALPALARGADGRWPAVGDTVVMDLPAPAARCEAEAAAGEEEEDGGCHVRLAKRRFVSTGDQCAICCDVMEAGLAAWPQCEHAFHGECLEQLLVRDDRRCPLCRSELRFVRPYN